MGSTIAHPDAGNLIMVATTASVEVTGALSRAAKRQRRLSLNDLQLVLDDFRTDWMLQYRIIRLSNAVLDQSLLLGEEYALRGYDAIQLASALSAYASIQDYGVPFTMVSSDAELNQAAVNEGLTVTDPVTV